MLERLALLTAVLVSLSAVAAGCGGPSAEEQWASDVCGELADWQDQVTKASDDLSRQLQSPGAGTLEAVRADINSISAATTTLSSDLRSLGPPDTPSGQEAKQQFDSLATQLDTTVQQAREGAGSVLASGSVSDVRSKVASLGTTLQTLSDSVSSTVTSVEAKTQALRDGFQKADSCEPYR